MVYNVVLTEFAEHQLDNIVSYVANDLCNGRAASAILNDVDEAIEQLRMTADIYATCTEPELAVYDYKKFHLRKHRYIMLYRVIGNDVSIERIYHEL